MEPTTPEAEPAHDTDRDAAGPAPEARRLRPVTLAVLTAALVGACAVLAYPLLPAITWGVALAILAWPVDRAVARRVGHPGLAASLSTAAVAALIVGPGLFVGYEITREAAAVARANRDPGVGALSRRVADVPVLGPAAGWMGRAGVDLEAELRRAVGSFARDAGGLAAGLASSVIQGLVALFLLYFLLRDRDELLGGLRAVLPLSGAEADRVFARAADSVHANLYATVVTALINTAGFGAAFWAFGLPAPFLWSAVMFVLSVLPVIGAALVWLPAAAYLALAGRWAPASTLLAWGAITLVAVDNFLYARLAGDRMRMHPAPALIAFLGGVAVFGASGMVLGPAIVAVTASVLEVWRARLSGEPAGERGGGPGPL